MRRTLFAFLASATLALPGTIVSVTGGPPHVFVGLAATSSWTQTSTYSNVSVAALLTNASGIGESFDFHAFLTTGIGPGTTVASEVASTSFSLAPGAAQNITLFSGLSLAAGTYFLTVSPDIGPNGGTGWTVFTGAPTVTTDSGVTRNVDRRFTTTSASYLPANSFITLTGGSLLWSVTAEPEPVPEPATTALIACGLAALGIRCLRVVN